VSDWLVKLYELPPAGQRPAVQGATLRKPIGPEHRLVVDWVGREFGAGWASEAQVALGNRPLSAFIAVGAAGLLGFACYDATARGLFGPIGVAPAARGQGLGAGLLWACLDDMRSLGYAYAVIGGVGPGEFYRRTVGAVPIEGSSPGLYRGMLRAAASPPPDPAMPVAPG
jgi:GNAT superfamily N-acetyltransferase